MHQKYQGVQEDGMVAMGRGRYSNTLNKSSEKFAVSLVRHDKEICIFGETDPNEVQMVK